MRFVAGADEAGRGCLAGPLVAAAVLFDYERLDPRELRALRALNDSKQHTDEAREELYPVVLRGAARVAVVSRCVRGIDARGLHKTNLAALRDALLDGRAAGRDLPVRRLLGRRLRGHTQRAIVDGDATSAAIAAASIVAKVTRDRYMHRADARHPGWEFADARRLLDARAPRGDPAHGVSPLHRMSFQSPAYQQLALVAGLTPIRTRPRGGRGAAGARRVDGHADRVEAQLGARGPVGALRQPRARHAPDLRAACRRASAVQRAAGPPEARRVLTSTKTSVVAVERDEVDLAEARAVVAATIV